MYVGRIGLAGSCNNVRGCPSSVWAMISQHQDFSHLDLHDFKSLAEELVVKVKCHG